MTRQEISYGDFAESSTLQAQLAKSKPVARTLDH
jgi:hypothetical protein